MALVRGLRHQLDTPQSTAPCDDCLFDSNLFIYPVHLVTHLHAVTEGDPGSDVVLEGQSVHD